MTLERSRLVAALFAITLILTVLCAARSARAAGVFASDRGVRPMGRAGAFVAGADDANAATYNPAGLAYAGGTTILGDVTVVHLDASYDRVVRVADSAGAEMLARFPTIQGSSSFLPYPAVLGSWAITDRVTLAGGFTAPYAGLVSFPTSPDVPSPARYALGSLDGSIAAIPGVWAAYKLTPWLRVGLGVSAYTGVVKVRSAINISPSGNIIGAPEQPEYDTAATITLGPFFAPSGHLGVIVQPVPWLRLGASGQSPTYLKSSASVDVQFPSGGLFASARQTGHDASMSLVLPPVVRLGVEVRPIPRLRAELAYVREFWSMHDSVSVITKGVAIEGLPGAPPSVGFPGLSIPRGFTDAGSIRLGAELGVDIAGKPVDLRAGVSRDSSAVPREYVSLLSLDADRITLSFGAGVHVTEALRIDALYAHQFIADVTVSPDEAKVTRIDPLGGNVTPVGTNGGTYAQSGNLFGLGAEYRFR